MQLRDVTRGRSESIVELPIRGLQLHDLAVMTIRRALGRLSDGTSFGHVLLEEHDLFLAGLNDGIAMGGGVGLDALNIGQYHCGLPSFWRR